MLFTVNIVIWCASKEIIINNILWLVLFRCNVTCFLTILSRIKFYTCFCYILLSQCDVTCFCVIYFVVSEWCYVSCDMFCWFNMVLYLSVWYVLLSHCGVTCFCVICFVWCNLCLCNMFCFPSVMYVFQCDTFCWFGVVLDVSVRNVLLSQCDVHVSVWYILSICRF